MWQLFLDRVSFHRKQILIFLVFIMIMAVSAWVYYVYTSEAESSEERMITVHIKGAVMNPDLYSLAAGSRVQDGITAAGGLRENADAEELNLAKFLRDGEELNIPEKIEIVVAAADAPGAVPAKVNINTADEQALMKLPGVGEATAKRIITYRTKKPFRKIDDIKNVSGIGNAKFEDLRDLICVE